jgi:Flp pilus assembly protein TadB
MRLLKNKQVIEPLRILWFAASLLIVWLACGLYIEPQLLRLLLALPAAILLLLALHRQQTGRKVLLAREQFKWFLELLLTRLTAGATLEHAISDTLPGMSQMLGSKSCFIKALHALDQQLKARRPLDALLPFLSRQIACPEAGYFFQLLPELRRTGSQMAPFVRQHLRMVSEQLSLQQEIKSETAQRRTEAALLAVMPFLMVLLLRSGFDEATRASMRLPAGVAGSAVACVIALAAGILTVSLMAFSQARPAAPLMLPDWKRTPGRIRHALWQTLHRLYREWLPAAYGTRLLQALVELGRQHPDYGQDQDDQLFISRYFDRKANLMLVSLLPAVLISVTIPGAWFLVLILPVAMAGLHDQQVFRLRRQILDDYRLVYPVLLNLLTALLQAGLSVHHSLQIACACLQPPSQTESVRQSGLLADLESVHRQMQTGRPVVRILEGLITHCPLPEAQAALLLLLRYEQSGGTDAIQLLTLQSNACWSLYRNSTRKQLEQQSLRLLLPMALDLVAVLITALLPAVLSLQML